VEAVSKCLAFSGYKAREDERAREEEATNGKEQKFTEPNKKKQEKHTGGKNDKTLRSRKTKTREKQREGGKKKREPGARTKKKKRQPGRGRRETEPGLWQTQPATHHAFIAIFFVPSRGKPRDTRVADHRSPVSSPTPASKTRGKG
jgi:FtsZ-interacting cell division protein YlmF